MLMEKAGTSGAIFRNFYRDFLKESYEILKYDEIHKAHDLFVDIVDRWMNVSTLFDKAGKTKEVDYINEASEMLVDLSKRKKLDV